jgi:hypothetical protein
VAISSLVVNQEGFKNLLGFFHSGIPYKKSALKPSWFNVPLARHCESPSSIIIAYWNPPGDVAISSFSNANTIRRKTKKVYLNVSNKMDSLH